MCSAYDVITISGIHKVNLCINLDKGRIKELKEQKALRAQQQQPGQQQQQLLSFARPRTSASSAGPSATRAKSCA